MKNYELLMAKAGRALKPYEKLVVHIFAHKTTLYDYEEGWMSTHIFSGGTMPSTDLLHLFQKDFEAREAVVGLRESLCEGSRGMNTRSHRFLCVANLVQDWLAKMNASKKEIWPHLVETYGKENAENWLYRWQIFYMACAELFAYEGGDTWGITHYLFEKPSSS
jgi:cation-transporting P-type ATPase 13A2